MGVALADGGVNDRLGQIASVFGLSSLLSIGGANTIVPHLQRQTVETHGWLTDRQFVDCFAIAQVVPGPNTLLATLLGYRASGLGGALVATLAMTLPAVLLAFVVCAAWLRSGHARWHVALEYGLAPIGVGLVAAAAVTVARAVDHGWTSWSLTLAALAALLATRANPLLVVLGGGVAGVLLGV